MSEISEQQTIPLDRVFGNPDQPRKMFEAKALEELAGSILENGLAQPITVRPMPVGLDGEVRFEIVMGERRFRAHQLLASRGHEAFAVIRANVRDMDDETRDVQAIVENMARADISPMEEAKAFQRMLDRGMSVEALARKLGLHQVRRITDRTALLGLSPEFQKMLATGSLSNEYANWICLVPPHHQTRLVQLVNRGAITGTKAMRAAVEAIQQEMSQTDMFGEAAPKVSDEDVAAINAMEAKIERMSALASAGWKDGECVVATKVSRDRARLMADKIGAMRTALLAMERDLRMAAAQAEIVFTEAA